MYNKFCNSLTTNSISFSIQFGFWAGHLIDHAIVELMDEVTCGFIENKYTFGNLSN